MTRRSTRDDGAAVLEFVFVAILVMVPLIYLVLAASALQRNAFGVTQAAREAGRAFATAPDAATGRERAAYAVRLAFEDQGLDATDLDLRFVEPRTPCDAVQVEPVLAPGTDVTICVVRRFHLPGVPGFLAGDNNTVTGTYVVHVDDFRSAR